MAVKSSSSRPERPQVIVGGIPINTQKQSEQYQQELGPNGEWYHNPLPPELRALLIKKFFDAHSLCISTIDSRVDCHEHTIINFAEPGLYLGLVVSIGRDSWTFEGQQNVRRVGRGGGVRAKRRFRGEMDHGDDSSDVRRLVTEISEYRQRLKKNSA